MTSVGGSCGEYRRNQGEKHLVWINGALSIKVPPYNKKGRQYGGARFINTRTDYSMSSMFGTNHKIMTHGLINSRDAYLRKIKLHLLLRWILRQDPNKYH